MPDHVPDLTPAQWEFLAVFEALGHAAPVDVVGDLAPLSPGPFLDLMRRAAAGGWLEEVGPDRFRPHPDMPLEIRKRLKETNTRDRLVELGGLLDRLGLWERLDPSCRSRFLGLAGRESEAAALDFEEARKFLDQGDLHEAARLLEGAVERLERLAEPGPIYVSAALLMSDLSLRLGRRLTAAPALLKRSRSVADRLGDRRSRALIDLHLGRFSYVSDNPSEAIASLVAGLDEVDDLGDEDILAQSSEFIGLYYFLQGRYRDAAGYFERCVREAQSGQAPPVSFFGLYTFGYCTAFLGEFHRSVGVLDYYLRQYREAGELGLTAVFQAGLGIVLVMMGQSGQARPHFERVCAEIKAHQNVQALLLARVGNAYACILEGRSDEAAELMQTGLEEAARAGHVIRQYSFPWILDILYEVRKRGRSGPGAPDLKDEIERLAAGPNISLRGAALRVRAMGALDRGSDLGGIEADLEAGLRYLKRSGDPVETAKIRVPMAVAALRRGEEARAAGLALEARAGLSAYGDAFLPAELKRLLERSGLETPVREPGRGDVLDRFLGMMEELIPNPNLDALLALVISTTLKFYGAERGGLFWVEDGRAPVLRASANLSAREAAGEGFQFSLGLIHKAFRTGEPVLVYPEPGDREREGRRPQSILCLPFEVQGRMRGVLYYDTFYGRHDFELLDRSHQRELTRRMGVYIERIREYSRLMEKRAGMAADQVNEGPAPPDIITRSPLMQALLETVDQVAASEASVVILGETGVGKELIARRVHRLSRRGRGPFVVVDLSAVPETLVESELFGHEKGAFTGADRQKAGRLELAHKGTLFIDEVGEIPLSVQTRLLRVIQEKTFVRVGGTRGLASDFRLVTATNRDLEREVARGRFRQDLYYRLNVVPLTVPPLRERGRDVIHLAEFFLEHYARKHHRPVIELAEEDLELLKLYHWPGNVRELKNVMERAVLLGSDQRFNLLVPVKDHAPEAGPFADFPSMDELQKRYIEYVLKRTHGRVGGPDGAAAVLGMKRTTLYTRMKKLGIS